MKTFKTLAMASLLLVLAVGCNSTTEKESMLSAAGFRTIPANTPQRQAHLRSLPPEKITQVQGPGTVYYTFPDPKRNVLYVGQEPQFQAYQQLRLRQQETMQQQLIDSRTEQDFTWLGMNGPFGEQFWASR